MSKITLSPYHSITLLPYRLIIYHSYKNHKSGYALVVPTKVRSGNEFETVARYCFINHDTIEHDIKRILDTMI